MRILLDTHCWLWWISGNKSLKLKARNLLEDPDNVLLFSIASCWEIAIKYAQSKIVLPEPPEDFIPVRLARDRIMPFQIQVRHALRVSSLPLHHRDPFDRLLIAQAELDAVPIMTADPKFKPYNVSIIPA